MTGPDPIPRLNAALEGRYRIERELGAGGMATVYLARDLRHNRNVALKVLKPELAAIVGAERFLVEIETTANLQHPHILPLFDSGEADGFLFYVMPYVEGESLRERLDREHQLPVDEAVQIAANVAEALDYAHARGVIHRDIKPANILLQSGKPVVSDFGIALAVSAGGAGRLTETGLSLGTPHYMSPEQATGDTGVGAATDIYALGCVLYEMLVGEPPYVGSTPQAILGKIIQAKPVSATEARRTVPANVDAVVRRALEKVPADRFPSAAALARALADPAFRHGEVAGAGIVPAGRWKAAALVSTSLAAMLGVALVGALQREDPPPPRVARFEAPFREGQGPTSLGSNAYALSPDGSMLVFNRGEATGQLWMRRWDDLEAIPIRGTAAGAQAVVSPDGEFLAFRQDEEIRVLSLDGGVTRTVGGGSWPRWAPNGDLYYMAAEGDGRAIMRAPSGGGAPLVARPDSGDLSFSRIWGFLPDGERALLAFAAAAGGERQLGVIQLETGELTPLGIAGDWPAFYTTSGHLLYWRDRTVMAAPFDPESLEVGDPVRIVDNVQHFDLSRDGTLAYSTFVPEAAGHTNLVLVTPEGGKEVLADLDGITWFPRFSPDGARLAYGLSQTLNVNEPGDLWVIDVARGARTRVTFEANNRWYPIWTRDGTRLTHADAVGNENRVLSTLADGSGGVDTIFDLGPRRFPTAWSPDGRTLAYYQGGQGAIPTRDIWMLRVDGPQPVESPLIQTEFGELGAIFSPDGQWVVYVSDKSGQLDVYARPFPGPGPEVTISVGGGTEPVWGPRGDQIYYRRPGELMVAPVQRSGSTLTVGTARQVMPDTYLRASGGGAGGMANYDIASDGSGFAMIEDVSGADTVEPARLFVVFNWLEELKRLVPTN